MGFGAEPAGGWPEPGVLATGVRAAVFEVALESGERIVLPRSNVEALAG
jgi:hypothetical protein